MSTEGGPLAAGELRTVSAAIGQAPSFVLWFEDFHAEAPFESIVDGGQDDHLSRWAHALRECGSPVYLRFAHEFNGDWYPWTAAQGTAPDQFRTAWRRIHDIFARQGAGNVIWVWFRARDVHRRRGGRPVPTSQAPACQTTSPNGAGDWRWRTAYSTSCPIGAMSWEITGRLCVSAQWTNE